MYVVLKYLLNRTCVGSGSVSKYYNKTYTGYVSKYYNKTYTGSV
jgi:hypothetical protein